MLRRTIHISKVTVGSPVRARHLVRGSLKTWHVYIDAASLAPQLDIFVIQHSFQALVQRHLFEPEAFVPSRYIT